MRLSIVIFEAHGGSAAPIRCRRCSREFPEDNSELLWAWQFWNHESGTAVCPGCLTALEERDIFGEWGAPLVSSALRALDPDNR